MKICANDAPKFAPLIWTISVAEPSPREQLTSFSISSVPVDEMICKQLEPSCRNTPSMLGSPYDSPAKELEKM